MLDGNKNRPAEMVKNKVAGIFFEQKVDYVSWTMLCHTLHWYLHFRKKKKRQLILEDISNLFMVFSNFP
jgi:hypothetical protein